MSYGGVKILELTSGDEIQPVRFLFFYFFDKAHPLSLIFHCFLTAKLHFSLSLNKYSTQLR